ncbi:MAG: ImmA/IrrE family metallo-endopeptidase, partial [Synergistaceae bacterium]|nr:ImmA/IrrE family metallo-endopeptidase [Synergistaceae bacterium]
GPIIQHWQKEGLLAKKDDKKNWVLRLRSILGVENLTVIPSLQINAAFRASNSNAINPYILFAWIKLCEMAVSRQFLQGSLDLERLKDSLPAIRHLMFADAGVLQKELAGIFGGCGIKFCIVPNFKGAPVQGFIEKNADNEMILCMAIRQKYADIFWFSLLHEVGHIIRGDISACFIDFPDASDEKERRADEFAKNVLIPSSSYENFLRSGDMSLDSIKKFATSIEVPPYIVIGRLQKENLIPCNRFANEKLRFDWA